MLVRRVDCLLVAAEVAIADPMGDLRGPQPEISREAKDGAFQMVMDRAQLIRLGPEDQAPDVAGALEITKVVITYLLKMELRFSGDQYIKMTHRVVAECDPDDAMRNSGSNEPTKAEIRSLLAHTMEAGSMQVASVIGRSLLDITGGSSLALSVSSLSKLPDRILEISKALRDQHD